MGDLLAKRYPNSGRIVLSQISSASAIPLAALLLLVLPDDPSSGFIHGLVLFIMGLSISWNGPATNKYSYTNSLVPNCDFFCSSYLKSIQVNHQSKAL